MKINEECEIIGHRFKPRYEMRRHGLEMDDGWSIILIMSLIMVVPFPFALIAYYFAGRDEIYVSDICSKCGLRIDK